MANKKISELDPVTSLKDTDLVPVVTDSDTTPKSKKITWKSLKAAVGGFPPAGYDLEYIDTIKLDSSVYNSDTLYTRYGKTIQEDTDYLYLKNGDYKISKFAKSDLSLIASTPVQNNISITAFFLEGDYLYVGYNNDSGYFIRKYNKSDMLETLDGSLNPIVSPDTGAPPNVVYVYGNYLYTLRTGNKLGKYNISDLTYTSVESPALTGSTYPGLVSDGTYLYYISYNNKIRKYNISDLTYTSVEGVIVGALGNNILEYDSGSIYIYTGSRYYEVDPSDLSTIVNLTIPNRGQTGDGAMYIDTSYIYLINQFNEMIIIDRSDNSMSVPEIISANHIYGFSKNTNFFYVVGYNYIEKFKAGYKKVILAPE